MAIQCNIADSHITGANSMLPLASEPFSLVCWMSGIWSAPASVKSFVGLYGPDAEAPTAAIQIGSRTTAGALQIWQYGGTVLLASAGGLLTDNRLHLIAMTYDGTTAAAFIDGQQVAQVSVSLPATKLTHFFINGYPPIGNSNETSTHTVESVRLYDRALRPAELLTTFNSHGSRHAIVDGLIAHYEFNEKPAGQPATTVVNWVGGANLAQAGADAPMTYTYSNGQTTLRPVL